MIDLLAIPLRAQRRTLRLATLCAVLAGLSGVGLLAVSSWFLAGAGLAGLAGVGAAQGFNYLLPSAAIRAAAITRTATRYGERMLGHRAALFALADLREALFGRTARAVLAGQAVGRGGEMASRLGADVDALEDAVIRRTARAGAWAAGAAGVVCVGLLGWRSACLLLIVLATMRVVAHAMAARLLPAEQDEAAAALAAMRADYADMAGPAADIAVYGLAPAMTAAHQAIAARHEQACGRIARAEGLIAAGQTAIAAAMLVVIAMVDADVVRLSLGLLAAMAALEIWAGLATGDMRAHRIAQATQRLAALDRTRAVPPAAPVSAAPAITIGGTRFPPGSRLRIGGPSGAGKTRLIETLAGLRQDAPQALAVDGRDPSEIGFDALRGAFALAGQDAPLIVGSLADNLALACPGIDEATMWEALRIACADDLARALPDGLRQWLGGDGARLSGGQRRRIVLARALLAGRAWLVLDEPSEGLDTATEARLVASLGRWLDTTGTGLILVSHRPAMAALTDTTYDL